MSQKRQRFNETFKREAAKYVQEQTEKQSVKPGNKVVD